MELFGKEYNVSQKVIKKRMGKLPCSNIEHVEKQIEKMEKEFNDNKNINMDLIHKLNTLYQTAVEYYSAINSPQFQFYTEKIKNLMGMPKINELIDKTKEEEKNNSLKNENNIQNKENTNEKEEKIITTGLNKIKSKLSSLSGKKDKKEKEPKKVTKPKVSLSNEDEDGGTLDVGSDDEEDEEEEDENDEKEDKNDKKEDEKEEKAEEKENEETKKDENLKVEEKENQDKKDNNKKEEENKNEEN